MKETSWAVGYRGALARCALLVLTLLALGYLALNARVFGIQRPGFLDLAGAGAFVYVLATLSAIGTIITLLVIYILDVVANPLLGWTARTVWIVALALGNVLAMPIYWALYLRRKRRSPNVASQFPPRSTSLLR